MCIKKFPGNELRKLRPEQTERWRERVGTSDIVLKAVELDADGIGTVQESDDVIDFGAGSRYNTTGAGAGGVGLLASRLERSRRGKRRRRHQLGRLRFAVAANVVGRHQRSGAPLLIQQLREP